MTAIFKTAEQIWAEGSTRYWFDVDGREIGVVESGNDVTYIDDEGYPITGGMDLIDAQRECIVTDEIRQRVAGL